MPGRQGQGQRQAGVAAAAAEVEQGIDSALAQDVDGAQAVEDVLADGGDGLADRAQVDRLVPGQQQPQVIDQGLPDRSRQIGQAQAGQPLVEQGQGLGRQLRQALNARRERFTVLAHASSEFEEVNRPLALPASTYVRTEEVDRSSAPRLVLVRISPGPSRVTLPCGPVWVRLLDAR